MSAAVGEKRRNAGAAKLGATLAEAA